MKLSISFFIVCLFPLSATVYSQNGLFTIETKNKTMRELFHEVEQQSQYRFFYSDALINIDREVSINVADKSINEVLDLALANSGNTYRILDNKLIVVSPTALLQVLTITGTVTDDEGEPLPGVSITIKGVTQGTATDAKGAYSLQVPDGRTTLVFSYIGFAQREIVVGNQRTINVTLSEDVREIDEIVVVGYGTVRKKDLTGSVAVVGNDLLTEQQMPNATMAIRGQVAGLDIRQTSGRVGGESQVFIRGNSGIGKNVQPLVIIDGIPANFNQLNDMDPNEIERLDILKDASSTAIYGSRAAGGVIIVTTRSGYESKNTINYSGSVGFKKITNAPKMMDTPTFYQFWKDGVAFGANPLLIQADDQEFIDAGINTDWLDMVTRDGFETKHSISLSGGGRNETHYLSLGYSKEDGVQKPDANTRYSLSTRISGKILNKFTLGASISATYSIRDLAGDMGHLTSAYKLRPWGKPFDEEGNWRFFPTVNETMYTHPLANMENTSQQRNRAYIRAGFYADFQPIEGLTIKTNLMPSFNMQRTGVYIGEMTNAKAGRPGTSTAQATNSWSMAYIWENTVSYNKRIDEHSFGFTGLFSMEDGRAESYQGNVTGLTYPGQYWYNNAASVSINSVLSSLEKESMISYMGRVNYGFRDKYLITATGRWDGSSKLAAGNQWGFFPSVALAWRAGEEEFIKDLDVFSNLKFRLSYGVSGLNDVSPYSSFATLNTTIYDWDGASAKGAAATMANRALSWEKSHEYDLGIDLGFLNERFTGVIDIYQRTTKGLILNRQIPSHQGVTSLRQNVGSVRNSGVELSINSMNIRNKQFTWKTSLNFTANKNEILELYGGEADDPGNSLFIGHPVSVEYAYDVIGVWQLGEEAEAQKYASKPGYLKVRDVDGDGVINPERDQVILGSQYPKWTAGITNTFTYKGMDLSFFIYTRQKVTYQSGLLVDLVRYWDVMRHNQPDYPYWTPDNPTNWHPSPGSPTNYGNQFSVEDCSFWRLQHVTLGYNFNKRKIQKAYGFSNLRAYLQVLNPLFITKAHTWDPEYARQGISSAPLNGVTFLFGVNVSL